MVFPSETAKLKTCLLYFLFIKQKFSTLNSNDQNCLVNSFLFTCPLLSTANKTRFIHEEE